jgi:hypothetical protein
MQKLRLDLDALVVESFDTLTDGRRGPGTVKGHNEEVAPGEEEDAAVPWTWWATCTCAISCFGSCQNTCETCPGDVSCVTRCHDTCASGGPVCCA